MSSQPGSAAAGSHTGSRVRVRTLVLGALLTAAGVVLFTRPLAAATAASVFLGLAQWQWAVSHVPQLASALAVAVALARATFLSDAAASRVRAGLWAVCSIVLLGLTAYWPDAAIILLGYAVAAGGVVTGVWIALGGVVRLRHPRGAWRQWVALAAVGALVAGGVAGTVARERNLTRASDFYAWDGSIPTQAGTLLRVGQYDGDVPAGSTGYLILYSTTYSDGSVALASAVVIVPDGATGSTVLAWQHGTTGVTQECAPSLTTDAFTPENIAGIDLMVERGWVIVATDYPGQGTAGRYPYLIGEGEGRAALDAVRAVQQLDGLSIANQVMLWGHSQGGHATLWAAQIADEYAPELPIVGVAALSAAQDPLSLARTLLQPDASPVVAVVAAYVLVPYSDEYADVRLSDAVPWAGIPVVQQMAARCPSDPAMAVSVLTSLASAQRDSLIQVDLDDGVFAQRLAENIATGDFTAPLFLGQGIDDEVIPIAMQRSFAADLEAQGKDPEVHEYAGRTHMGVLQPDSPLIADLFSWADAVLAG